MTLPHTSMTRARTADVMPAGEPATTSGSELLSLVATVLRYWRSVALCALILPALLVLPVLLRSRLYEVTATFMPQARRGAGNISGLAAQLGINFPQAEGGASPQFYMELLKSPEMLRSVVISKFRGADAGGRSRDSTTLVDREKQENPGDPLPVLIKHAIEHLDEHMAVSISAKTGIVTLSIRDRDPVVARDLTATLLKELNRFNLETRQSQAAAERAFTEQRLATATSELRATEARRQAFASSNRGFRSASELTLEQERLRRDVDNAAQVYSMLTTAYEQAKIEEVRDTPIITLVELPRVPPAPVGRGLVVRAVLGIIVGVIIGVLLALLRARLRLMREVRAPGWVELEAVIRHRRLPANAAAGRSADSL
jgi:uncharacterized protein involved in exopolysaccharide biosynthesis